MDEMKKKHTVLITGATGLIGKKLSTQLQDEGHTVKWLSRDRYEGPDAPNGGVFYWNLDSKVIEERAFENVDTIIHLAGANIGEQRWTADRKREIMRSRIVSARLIFNKLKVMNHSVKTFISASAIGYYGAVTRQVIFDETSPMSNDFLSKTCFLWEREAHKFEELGIRTVIFRNGVVLSKDGGLLPKMIIPVKFGINLPMGTGHQYINWIHIDDIVRIYIKGVEDENLVGVYNAVAPGPLTNEQFMYALSYAKGGERIHIKMPEAILKTCLGEMSQLILEGTRVSAEKIKSTGFIFEYPSLNKALHECID